MLKKITIGTHVYYTNIRIERREERMFGTRHTIQQQLFVQNYAAHSASEPTLVDTI